MLGGRVVQAENHAGRGDGGDRQSVKGLSVLRWNKRQNAWLQIKLPSIKDRRQILRRGPRTFPEAHELLCRWILIHDPSIPVADDDYVLNARQDSVVEGEKPHQLVIEEVDGIQLPPGIPLPPREDVGATLSCFSRLRPFRLVPTERGEPVSRKALDFPIQVPVHADN